MTQVWTRNDLADLWTYLTPQEQGEILTLLDEPDPVAWIESEFWIPEDNGPIRLVDYQRACLREALRRESGEFVYSLILWSDIKKSAKSTIAAGVALWRANQVDWGHVRIIANDLKQADSRVSYYLRRALELHPTMRETYTQRGYTVTLPNHTVIEAVPIDPRGEAGGGDDMVVFSELWGAKHDAAQRMWTETTLSPLKYGQSFRWVETYAGYLGESPLLEQLYEQGVKEGRPIGKRLGFPDLEVYANDAARMFCLWNTVQRCPWQTDEYYAQEAAALTPNEFERIHRNQWVSSTEAFCDPLWWEACKEALPDLDKRAPLVLGVDAATTLDCFAVVGVTRHPDKTRQKADVAARFCKVWKPPKGGEVDYSKAEAFLRKVCENYHVVEIAYDPHQLKDMMQRFRREGVARCREFRQGEARLNSDKALLDLIIRRGIAHGGLPELAEHLTNADRKVDADTQKLRIVKRQEHLKIDAAVALSMAAAECLRLNLG